MAVIRPSAATVAAAAALALACGGTSAKPGPRLIEPSAIAVASMRTTKVLDATGAPAVHPYYAVANAGSADLRLFDAWDDVAVLAPVAFWPLSVPVPLPQPAMLAAATLPDAAGAAKPDALVVVPSGSAELQLVDTWSGLPRIVSTLPLAPLLPPGDAAQVISIVGAAVPVSGAPAPDRARFILGLTGARLAVVEVDRAAGGEAISFGPATVQDIGFEAVSLAFAPTDPATLYAATPDPLGTVAGPPARTLYGVAQIDTSAAPPWTFTPLDARAPTTRVAAFDVVERSPFDVGPIVLDGEAFGTTPARRVYAMLDPAGCGPDQPISCGLAILDPSRGGLLADPSGEAPFAAPVPVPGVAAAVIPAGPPADPPTCPDPTVAAPGCLYEPSTTESSASSQASERRIFVSGSDVLAMFPLAAGSGQRWTTAAAAVPTSDGAAYLVDLARWGLPPERSVLRSLTRTSATTASTGPYDLSTAALVANRIGLVLTTGTSTAPVTQDVLDNVTSLLSAITVTPGYTPSEAWHVEWQGKLPSLDTRAAELVRTTGGGLSVAIQVTDPGAPAGAPPYLSVAQVYDPRLGVHAADTAPDGVGDVVEVTVPASVATRETAPGSGVTICTAAVRDAKGNVTGYANATSGITFEAAVASLAPPAADHPGGALLLDGAGGPGAIVPVASTTTGAPAIVPGKCDFAAAQPDPTAASPDGLAVAVTVRAAKVLLRGDVLGYAGRPTLGAPYALRWQSEDALLAGCPLLSGSPAAACDATCRASCESLVLARKARRLFYLDDTCPKDSAVDSSVGHDPCVDYWPPQSADPANGVTYAFPQPIGPAIMFTPIELVDAACPNDPSQVCPVPSTATMLRGTYLQFTTQQGGSAWMTRRPTTASGAFGAAVPAGGTTFDRSVDPSRVNDGMRFLVPYPDNLVLDFCPGQSITDVTVVH